MKTTSLFLLWCALVVAEYKYPSYCAKVDKDFIQLRSIPLLNLPKDTHTLDLLQVIVIARHGSRTTSDKFQCWKGYNPHWDCDNDVHSTFQSSINTLNGTAEDRSQWLFRSTDQAQTSKKFVKIYDANSHFNVLGGNCLKGQLLEEGYRQHRIIGESLAKAYQLSNDPHNVIPGTKLLDEHSSIEDQIYFRSSDMHRTLSSGSALLTAFLQ